MADRDIVKGFLPGEQVALPADENGRPLDPVAASWWDGGFGSRARARAADA